MIVLTFANSNAIQQGLRLVKLIEEDCSLIFLRLEINNFLILLNFESNFMNNPNIKGIDNVGGNHSFSISKLLPGVYYISLTGAKGQNFRGKLVVIR